MQDIVFDDLNTPHFRQRNKASEDKTLEEAVKKQITVILEDPAEPSSKQTPNLVKAGSLTSTPTDLKKSRGGTVTVPDSALTDATGINQQPNSDLMV